MSKRKSRPQKRRRRSIIAFEMIRLDRTAKEPLHEQLYRQIRDELKSGRFSDGSSRLPSSRTLATDRGISRSTVRLALSKLHAEGYLRSEARVRNIRRESSSGNLFDRGPTENLPTNPAAQLASLTAQKQFRIDALEISLTSGRRAQDQASRWSQAFQQSTNFQ